MHIVQQPSSYVLVYNYCQINEISQIQNFSEKKGKLSRALLVPIDIPHIIYLFQCGEVYQRISVTLIIIYMHVSKHMSEECMIQCIQSLVILNNSFQYIELMMLGIMFCRIGSTEFSENSGCSGGISIYLKSYYMPRICRCYSSKKELTLKTYHVPSTTYRS